MPPGKGDGMEIIMALSRNLDTNIENAYNIFPLGKSFDLITRNLFLGKTRAFWIGINGFFNNEFLQRIFSDLQNPLYTDSAAIYNIELYMNSKIGYSQSSLTSEWDVITKSVLSGASVLFIDHFDKAIIIDCRSYPTRGIEEPDTEKVLKGAKDGFVENMLRNTILIRRRIRSPKLTFEMHSIGTDSKTDVALTYIGGIVDEDLLKNIRTTLSTLSKNVTSLTMGSKSLDELLIKKRWFNPLPNVYSTERPDVVCSYLLEGYIALIVDNSPAVLILPCTIFQFTQSPEDYYKSPATGNYLRFIRFACLFASLLLLPVFLLLGGHYNDYTNLITSGAINKTKLFIYIIFIELGLDLFKYSSSHSSSRFSNALAIIGGLVISDVAIQLKWTSLEVIFYGAATMLATLSIANIEFAESIKVYRIFLILCTGFFGIWGFIVSIVLIFMSIITTPSLKKRSYLWPLVPFNWQALKKLLFRYPTTKAQPSKVWNRQKKTAALTKN